MHDLPPYEDRCALLHLDTPTKRRSIACVMFIFDFLSGRVNPPNLLSVLNLITPRYPTCGATFLRIDFHRTNYDIHEPMLSAMRQFNGRSDPESFFELSKVRLFTDFQRGTMFLKIGEESDRSTKSALDDSKAQ
jgi:hypothetical protein